MAAAAHRARQVRFIFDLLDSIPVGRASPDLSARGCALLGKTPFALCVYPFRPSSKPYEPGLKPFGLSLKPFELSLTPFGLSLTPFGLSLSKPLERPSTGLP
jgi:hypothetical protein